MGAAKATAGWVVLIMVGVTAIAAWPVRSARCPRASGADPDLRRDEAYVHHELLALLALEVIDAVCGDPGGCVSCPGRR